MNNKSKIISAFFSIVVVLLQLLFLYYVKYSNQQLLLADFDVRNIGNILNLSLTSVIVIGLLVYIFQKKKQVSPISILIFTVILILLLGAAYYSIQVRLPFKEYYYFGQNGNKLFIGFLFLNFLFVSLMFASYIWSGIISKSNLVILRSAVNAVIVIFVLLLFSFYHVNVSDPQIDNKSISKGGNNVAVVLGAAVWSINKPSPILAARVDKALELLAKDLVTKVQLTGGNAPGEKSESEVALSYALEKYPDSTKFLIESRTSTTNEQIHFIRDEMLSRSSFDDVIVISDRFHLVRIEEISKFNQVRIKAVSSDLKLSFETELYNRLRESIGLLFFWFFAI